MRERINKTHGKFVKQIFLAFMKEMEHLLINAIKTSDFRSWGQTQGLPLENQKNIKVN